MDSPLKKTLSLALLLASFWCPPPASAAPKDLVLVLDNSGSMKNNDPDFLTGVAVRRFLDQLDDDSRVAILIFDQQVRLALPLTPLNDSSRKQFLQGLEQVNYKGLHTDSPAAIERAIYELKVNGRPAADRSIVFMTDGIVDTGNQAMDAEKSAWLRDDLASEAADEKIRIFGIAFTDNADFMLIQSLSQRTSGEYFRAYGADDIENVFGRIRVALAGDRVAAGAAAADDLPDAETALNALPQPAPLPALKLPEASPLFSDLPPDPEPLHSNALEQDAAATAHEDRGTAETVTLPTLPDGGNDVEAPERSQRQNGLAQAGEDTATLSAAPESKAELSEISNPAQARPPADPDSTTRVGTVERPASLAAAAAAGALGVALLAMAARLVRRRAPVNTLPQVLIPKAFLNDLGGITDKPSYELGDSLTVIGRIKGSDDDGINYVVIPEPTVGRSHALIEFKNQCFWVTDQSSLNGTYVNDKRIEGETRLKHGDRIRFHSHEFEFLLLDMFETDRTMMSKTVFADGSGSKETEDRANTFSCTDEAKHPRDPGGE